MKPIRYKQPEVEYLRDVFDVGGEHIVERWFSNCPAFCINFS